MKTKAFTTEDTKVHEGFGRSWADTFVFLRALCGFRSGNGKDAKTMQSEVHSGKTITDLSELVERAEAKAGCYGSGEPSADDPIDYPNEPTLGFHPATPTLGASGTPGLSAIPIAEESQDSCGTGTEVGKVDPGQRESSVQSRPHPSPGNNGPVWGPLRSESQQSCAGLGAEWGIPPAGTQFPTPPRESRAWQGPQFGAAADGAPFVAPSSAPYPGSVAAPIQPVESPASFRAGPTREPSPLPQEPKHASLDGAAGWCGAKMEALILAQSSLLLSRALAYVGLAELDCARAFAVEIRDHVDAINAYALARGIGMELVEAQLTLMSVTGNLALGDATA